jgi:TetR/AcrR family transcriptional regulator
VPLAAATDLMLAMVMGKLAIFARTDFKRLPTEHFEPQWRALAVTLFEVAVDAGRAAEANDAAARG